MSVVGVVLACLLVILLLGVLTGPVGAGGLIAACLLILIILWLAGLL